MSRQELLTLALPDEIVDQLRSVDHEFAESITRLSLDVWDRKDDRALRLISACVIDLPGRILIGRRRYSVSVVREYLRAAIRGIVEAGPPPVDL
ncbi:hypothetical protein H7I94_06405 [Mycobacterium szulgai]|nr:hypothetical protein [Mycobacterium szulgai]